MGISVVYGLYTSLLVERLYLTQEGKNSIILKLASVAQPVEQLIRNDKVKTGPKTRKPLHCQGPLHERYRK